MKRIILIFVLIGSFSSSKATNGLIYTSVEDGVRIEAINEYAFFILKVANNQIEYGDKVELVFGFNHKIKLYNLSGKGIHTFTNPNELVVLLAPEDLRCFKKMKLRKVNIYSGDKKLVVKTNISPDEIKIK